MTPCRYITTDSRRLQLEKCDADKRLPMATTCLIIRTVPDVDCTNMPRHEYDVGNVSCLKHTEPLLRQRTPTTMHSQHISPREANLRPKVGVFEYAVYHISMASRLKTYMSQTKKVPAPKDRTAPMPPSLRSCLCTFVFLRLSEAPVCAHSSSLMTVSC